MADDESAEMTSNPAPFEPGSVAWLLDEIAAPVVAELFLQDEFEGVTAWVRDGMVGVHITACGEVGTFYIWASDWPAETAREARVRLASQVEDFIAESRFGWGQQRVYGGE